MSKAALLGLCAAVVLVVVSGCGSSVEIAEQAECPIPDRAVSSVEALSYARCLVPGSEDAEVIGYSSREPHDDASIGRFKGWSMVLRYEGVYYSGGVHIGSAGFNEREIAPADCALGTIRVLDSVDLISTAIDLMTAIDPFSEAYKPYMGHCMSCLGWNGAANSSPMVYFFSGWEGPEPYRHVIFDDSGEVAQVCSENACDAGQTEYCCE